MHAFVWTNRSKWKTWSTCVVYCRWCSRVAVTKELIPKPSRTSTFFSFFRIFTSKYPVLNVDSCIDFFFWTYENRILKDALASSSEKRGRSTTPTGGSAAVSRSVSRRGGDYSAPESPERLSVPQVSKSKYDFLFFQFRDVIWKHQIECNCSILTSNVLK